MGWEADRMQDEAMRWAYESQVCANGHRYLEDGYGCIQCEMNAEVDAEWETEPEHHTQQEGEDHE